MPLKTNISYQVISFDGLHDLCLHQILIQCFYFANCYLSFMPPLQHHSLKDLPRQTDPNLLAVHTHITLPYPPAISCAITCVLSIITVSSTNSTMERSRQVLLTLLFLTHNKAQLYLDHQQNHENQMKQKTGYQEGYNSNSYLKASLNFSESRQRVKICRTKQHQTSLFPFFFIFPSKSEL